MALPHRLQSALHKYAFDPKNPTGAGLPKSLTAPKPSAPLGPDLMDMARSNARAAAGATPRPAKLLGAGPTPSIGAGPKPVGNNVIFSNQNAPTAAPKPGGAWANVPANAGPPRPGANTVYPAGGATSATAAPAQRTPGILREGEAPRSHTGWGSYVDVLDRWYNPWTTQKVTERGEEGLMRAGQTAMGIGAGAAATAAAIPAAAATLPATAQGLAGLGTGATGGVVGLNANTALVGMTAATASGQAMGAMPQQQPTPPAETAEQPQQTQPAPAGQQQPGAQAQPGQQPANPAQPDAAKPAAPMTPDQKQQANTDVMTKLNSDIPDAEKKQIAQQHVQQMLDSNPEMKQGMADLHAGKDTPQAKAFQAEVDKAGNAYIREEFAKLRQQNPGATPQQQGGMLQGIMDSYQSMPEPMKWMMGIGLGGGLLGILGSMFGGGGGMGMLGLLGLGAAGLAGAAGGMFGTGAQDALGGMVGQLGQATGMIPKDIDLSALKGEDAVDRATQKAQGAGGGIMGRISAYFNPEGAAKDVKGQLGQADQLNRLMMVPEGMRPGLLRQISPNSSPEEIQQILANANKMHAAMNDPKHQLGQRLQQGREFVKDPRAFVNNEAANTLSGILPWNWGGKSGSARGYALAQRWAKEAADKDIKEWLRKYRARGQGGRWVNTRRSSKMEKRVACA